MRRILAVLKIAIVLTILPPKAWKPGVRRHGVPRPGFRQRS